jgi:nicotinate-nucleotide adenylyltransferase
VAPARRCASVGGLTIRVVPDSRGVGILGGTFDPIHCGHLDIGDVAVRALNLRRLYVMTASAPPHRRQPCASAFHRFAMVSIAVGGRDGWRASDLELRTPAPSYTSATLKTFHARGYQPRDLFFVVGADAFAEVETWHDYPAILRDAHFAVVSRPAFPVDMLPGRLPSLGGRMVKSPSAPARRQTPTAAHPTDLSIFLIDAQTMDVSSSGIRERCRAGVSIAGLVPAGVQQHIVQHGLYTLAPTGEGTPRRRASDASEASEAGRMHGQD